MAGKGMREIKQRIRSVTNMEHITSAMKLVSTAKLRRAKDTSERVKKYFHFVTSAIEDVFQNASEIESRYIKNNGKGKKCVIVITSCKGLCGSFNSNVIKETEALIGGDKKNSVLVCIGTKGRDYFARRGYEIASEYALPPETISFLDTHLVSKPVVDMYDSGRISEVVLVTTAFVNTMTQEVRTIKLLPFEMKKQEEPDVHKPHDKYVEYEPSVEAVFDYLAPKYAEIMIYGAIVESVTCEHAARRMAMENATDNAREIMSQLTLNYNRARQAAITQELTEIIGGADALE